MSLSKEKSQLEGYIETEPDFTSKTRKLQDFFKGKVIVTEHSLKTYYTVLKKAVAEQDVSTILLLSKYIDENVMKSRDSKQKNIDIGLITKRVISSKIAARTAAAIVPVNPLDKDLPDHIKKIVVAIKKIIMNRQEVVSQISKENMYEKTNISDILLQFINSTTTNKLTLENVCTIIKKMLNEGFLDYASAEGLANQKVINFLQDKRVWVQEEGNTINKWIQLSSKKNPNEKEQLGFINLFFMILNANDPVEVFEDSMDNTSSLYLFFQIVLAVIPILAGATQPTASLVIGTFSLGQSLFTKSKTMYNRMLWWTLIHCCIGIMLAFFHYSFTKEAAAITLTLSALSTTINNSTLDKIITTSPRSAVALINNLVSATKTKQTNEDLKNYAYLKASVDPDLINEEEFVHAVQREKSYATEFPPTPEEMIKVYQKSNNPFSQRIYHDNTDDVEKFENIVMKTRKDVLLSTTNQVNASLHTMIENHEKEPINMFSIDGGFSRIIKALRYIPVALPAAVSLTLIINEPNSLKRFFKSETKSAKKLSKDLWEFFWKFKATLSVLSYFIYSISSWLYEHGVKLASDATLGASSWLFGMFPAFLKEKISSTATAWVEIIGLVWAGNTISQYYFPSGENLQIALRDYMNEITGEDMSVIMMYSILCFISLGVTINLINISRQGPENIQDILERRNPAIKQNRSGKPQLNFLPGERKAISNLKVT